MVEIKMEKKILNLTQHLASPEQKEAGVFEPADKQRVKELLTFDEIPDISVLGKRAIQIANIAKSAGADKAMIGGAPFFMAPLEAFLVKERVTPLYAFSERVVEEDGNGKKTAIFKHLGFVEGVTTVISGRETSFLDRITTCLIYDYREVK
jgi:hypothetical protein